MLFIGEVWDAKSIAELIFSASITGDSIPDFENLGFKIASGILTRNTKKQITTAKGQAPSEKRSLTGRQIARMIYDFFKISGDNDAILDFRSSSKVQVKNNSIQAFDTKWDEVLSRIYPSTEYLCRINSGKIKLQLHKQFIRKKSKLSLHNQKKI